MDNRAINENGGGAGRRRAAPVADEEGADADAVSAWEQMVQELVAEGLMADESERDR